MKKILITISALLLSLLLGVTLLLSTHTGSVLVWQQLTRYLQHLEGELVSGRLVSGWHIRNLSWQDESTIVAVTKLEWSWEPVSLWHGKLPVSSLDIEGARVELLPEVAESGLTDRKTASETTQDSFVLPVDLSLPQISIRDFRFENETTEIQLDSLDSALQWNAEGLVVSRLQGHKAQVRNKPVKASKETAQVKLPEVTLPFLVQVKQAVLLQLELSNAGSTQQLSDISLTLDAKGSTIKGIVLSASHSLMTVSSHGEIELKDDYPLSIEINASLTRALPALKLTQQQVTADISGTLEQLRISLEAQGDITASILGSVHPLTTGLPFDLDVNWHSLQWPISGSPQVTATAGQLRAQGSLAGYQLDLDSDATIPSHPELHLSLQGEGDLDALNIARLQVKSVEKIPSDLLLSGKLGWSKDIFWQGKAVLKNLNPGIWFEKVPGRLNGTIQSELSLKEADWQLEIPELNLSGELRGYSLHTAGSLSARNIAHDLMPLSLSVKNLEARIGDNSLHVTGSTAQQWNMNVAVNAPQLDELHPELKGSVTGVIQLTDKLETPAVSLSLQSPNISFQGFSLTSMDVKGKLDMLQDYQGQLNLAVGELTTRSGDFHDIRLQAEGNRQHHVVSLSTKGQPAHGSVELAGNWSSGYWNGELQQAGISTPIDTWQLKDSVSIKVDPSLQEVMFSQQCWLSGETSLCIDTGQVSRAKGAVGIELKQFAVQKLKPLWPDEFSWQAQLEAKGQLGWQDKDLNLQLDLQSTPGVLGTDELSFDYHKLNSALRLDHDQLTGQLVFESEQLGQANINLAVDDVSTQQKLSGKLLLSQLKLDFLAPFIPEVSRFDGVLSADTRLGGSLEKPLLFGDVDLKEGRLETDPPLLAVTAMETHLQVNGSQADISGVMHTGESQTVIGGNLNWGQLPVTGKLTLKGQDIESRYPGLFRLKMSPDLQLDFGHLIELHGQVVIPWARVEVKSLPKTAVRVSDDVVMLSAEKKKSPESTDSSSFRMNVKVILGKDIKLDAYGLKAGLEGELGLRQGADSVLAANGSINLNNGRYRYLGQDLLIQEGRILFSGPIQNPYLVVDAIRNPEAIADNVRVGIKVTGSVKRPGWEIYSNPSMSQQEQLSYLLQGRGLDNGDNSPVQALLVDVGVSQFGGLASSVGEVFGFADVRLDTEGSGDDTKITIGGNIAPGLRLQYGAGVFNSLSEIKVRYELMPKLYLQAVSGVGQAVDLLYQFKIKGNK
ncbi:autotransporter assembly complex protein TamB [Spongorhabdus nitratireducens]